MCWKNYLNIITIQTIHDKVLLLFFYRNIVYEIATFGIIILQNLKYYTMECYYLPNKIYDLKLAD